MLDRASTISPHAQWWPKGDACDLVAGLEEYTKSVWSGDADLDDHSLQQSYQQYQRRLRFVQNTGLEVRSTQELVTCDRRCARDAVNADLEFLYTRMFA